MINFQTIAVFLATFFCASSLMSAPTVNGVVGASEYDLKFDDPDDSINEVPAPFDLIKVHISGGPLLYIAWEMKAAYDVDGEDDEGDNFLRLAVDWNNDNVTDFRVRFEDNDGFATVFRGASGFADSAGTSTAVAATPSPEVAVPWEFFNTMAGLDPVFNEGPNTFQVRWRVDGGGDSADDSFPSSTGWQSITVNRGAPMEQVPTLNEWGIIILTGALAFAAFLRIRRISPSASAA